VNRNTTISRICSAVASRTLSRLRDRRRAAPLAAGIRHRRSDEGVAPQGGALGREARRHSGFVGRYGFSGSDWHQPIGHSHYLGLAPVLPCRGSSAPKGDPRRVRADPERVLRIRPFGSPTAYLAVPRVPKVGVVGDGRVTRTTAVVEPSAEQSPQAASLDEARLTATRERRAHSFAWHAQWFARTPRPRWRISSRVHTPRPWTVNGCRTSCTETRRHLARS